MDKQLRKVLIATAIAGIATGFLITRHLGKEKAIAFGGGMFAAGAGLQVLQTAKSAKSTRRTQK